MALARPETPARAERRIGRYRVVGRIGKGGMGMVYRGLDEALEREVAVKTLTLEGTLDEESRRRFEIEAKAAARLQHPNIVTVYELGEDRGVPFIAMELLPGMDLEGLLRSGEPLLPAELLDVVLQVCRGLAYAHEHKIVHRDIKPSNIRLLDDGTAKIMDFGIAKLGGTQLTRAGMMVGTVHYMSPEQVRGQALDGRSDVFSLGVILYELVAGRRPFKGEGATEILYKIVHEPPPPVDLAWLGGVAPRLQEILARALAKKPDERYATAGAFADELEQAIAELAREPGASTLPASESTAEARRLARSDQPEEAVRRLEELAATHPGAVDVRRALRGARRELQRRQKPAPAQPDDFPELDVTFRSAAPAEDTMLQPTTVLEAPSRASAPPARKAPLLVLGLAAVGLGVAALGFVLLRRPAPVPAAARLAVRSQPVGARVFVDGRDTGVVTNGELVLPAPYPPQVVLTFRMSGHGVETRTVKLPLREDETVSVSLPAAEAVLPIASDPTGATVAVDGEKKGTTPLELSLDPAVEHKVDIALAGHAAQQVRLEPGRFPAQVSVRLQPDGPLGTVVVSAAYPIEVTWRGRVLAKDQAVARVQLPAGKQTLTLSAPSVFLRRDVTVTVASGGESGLEAPGTGKLNIRALPDNCRVFIDGAFVDYPPVLDKAVAAGAHTVSFQWPDGARSQEAVEVARGGTAFVTGRRD